MLIRTSPRGHRNVPVRSGHTAGKHPSAESIQTTQPHSVEGWARPVTRGSNTSSHTSMRRHQLLLVGLILNSVLADLCNQTTGTTGGCSGQSQECVESNLGVGGNCYCTGTCFLNGACTENLNAYCIFNTATDCSSISNSQCRYFGKLHACNTLTDTAQVTLRHIPIDRCAKSVT